MPGPRSLAEMAFRVVMANVSAVSSLPGVPFEYARRVLKAVKSAEHLRLLEVSCESDDLYANEWPEHWKRLIKADFPALSAKHNFVPKDPRSWHKVYQKYKRMDDEMVAAATAKLEQDMAAKAEEENSRRATFLSASQGRKLQPKGRPKGDFRDFAAARPRPPPVKQLSAVQKARQEMAQEAKRFKLATPTGQVKVPAGQLKKAPAAMVEDARRRSQPSLLPPSPKQNAPLPPKPAKAEPRAYVEVLEFSDDEDSGAKDDDLFGDREIEKRPPPPSRPAPQRPSQPLRTGLLSAAPSNKKTQMPPPSSRLPTKSSSAPTHPALTPKVSPTVAPTKRKRASDSAPTPPPRGSPTSLPAPASAPARPKPTGIPSNLEVVDRPPTEANAADLPPQSRVILKRKAKPPTLLLPFKRPRRS
ncbi:uncharacterized protein B0T15DRAFT_25546 [Chaetomium strumarium]|uniref:Elongin-A n=1 Tax=Chaetomium strumarium TaxID=1170767 RepID=A0AAJ0H244_9PEZI|nr:hypothetical protein B0T15DRAFT_25546 [Chaetomium strumarium]